MKIILTFFTIVIISSYSVCQISLNTTGAAADNSAAWDIQYTDKGILIPRVALTQTTSTSPISAAPATSLLIYNTATVNDVSPGYYYWSGTRWIRVLGSDKAWMLDGNAGTNPAVNFLGTTDAQDLVIRTNNTERMRVQAGGNVGISTSAPSDRLHVEGGGIIVNNATNEGGRIRIMNTSKVGATTRDWSIWNMTGAYGNGLSFWRYYADGTNAGPVMWLGDNGNVGIGTTTPVSRLQVIGKTTLSRDGTVECCGNNATLAIADNPASSGRASISFHNGGEAEGTLQLIQNTINGISSRRFRMFDNQNEGMGLELTGRLWYGSAGSRTETRNNAGLQGNAGAQSGFFETENPVNFPTGASSWWHLLDVRHQNSGNNYAMQFAGSFFDQRLWFRKTNNNPAQPWTEILTTVHQTRLHCVTGTTDAICNSANWVDCPQLSITFVPVRANVIISFSASGYGYTNSMAWVAFRALVNGNVLRGTVEKIQNYDNATGTVTTWSASLIVPATVNVGVNNTILIQWMRSGISGTYDAVNYCNSEPSICHRTLLITE